MDADRNASDPTGIDPARLREIAVEVCRRAAVTIRETDRRTPVATKSSRTDIVTATDLEAERVIREAITELAPGSFVLGEEGGHQVAGDGPHDDLEWVVDPLDGTVNFAYGVPICAVSVAATRDGRPVAGAVIDLERDEMFSAHRGGGATLDGTPLAVNPVDDPSLALVATGFAYDAHKRVEHGATITRLLGEVRDVRGFGSAALHLCWVAAGRVDAYVERHIKPWDHCAGGLVAEEAGARVELPCPENDHLVAAAAPQLYRAIRPLLDPPV